MTKKAHLKEAVFAECGKNFKLGTPFDIIGTNAFTAGIKYIHIGSNVSLGNNVTIYATRAHLYLKDYVFSGPGLTIMTGDHPWDVIGKRMCENNKAELEKIGYDISCLDKDVIIEEDVWLGSNVTILKGVTIGEGSIVAGGSVVTKSFPPFSIIGGVPAKIIKKRFDEETIKRHKSLLNSTEPGNSGMNKE